MPNLLNTKNFSIKYYTYLMETIKNNYKIIDYQSVYEEDYKKTILVRHDIDVSLYDALKLAEVEATVGIKATYFIWLRSNFYNPLSIEGREIIEKIITLGHDIGLHFDPTSLTSGANIDDAVRKEVEVFESMINTKITAVSFHQPPKELISSDNEYLANLPQVYSKTIFDKFTYFADSNCKWSKPIEELIKAEHKHIQFLVHPVWWTNSDVEDKFRVLKSISKNKMHDEIYHLSLSGLFNAK